MKRFSFQLYACAVTIVLLMTHCEKTEKGFALVQKTAETTFVDSRDGQSYRCITIGNQTWMAENLKFRLPYAGYDGAITYNEPVLRINILKEQLTDSLYEALLRDEINDTQYRYFDYYYLDGNLPSVDYEVLINRMKNNVSVNVPVPGTEFFGENTLRIIEVLRELTLERLAQEYTDFDFVNAYGYLYTYDSAVKAVPAGWRIPTDDDWKTLEKNLGMSAAETDKMEQWRGINQGDLLQHDDNLGFKALLAGGQIFGNVSRHTLNGFANNEVKGYFWTSTPSQSIDSLNTMVIRSVELNNRKIYRGVTVHDSSVRPSYFSVRCIKE